MRIVAIVQARMGSKRLPGKSLKMIGNLPMIIHTYRRSKMAKNLADEYKLKNLCLAGGVALNCVANGKILKEKIFENIWIQPAAGDAGGSLGAALAYWHLELMKDREIIKSATNVKIILLLLANLIKFSNFNLFKFFSNRLLIELLMFFKNLLKELILLIIVKKVYKVLF